MTEVDRGLPHPMDVALGARIRTLRNQADLSLETMAAELSISPPALQKYEMGINRVGFSRLCEIANVLRISVSDLIGPLTGAAGAVKKLTEYTHLLQQPGAMELLLAFARLDATARKLATALVKALAGK